MKHDAPIRTIAALAALFAVIPAAGCATDQADEQVAQSIESATVASTTQSTETVTVSESPSPAPRSTLTPVDPGDFAAPGHRSSYVWNYSTGGSYVGLCVSDGDGVTCTGRPAPTVPDLTEHFPGRPGAIELGSAGLRYTFVEGIPPVSSYLETGQRVEIGSVRCAKPDAGTLECNSGGNSFAVSGPGQSISTSGTVLAERDYANHPDAGATDRAQAAPSGSASGQPTDFMGATGLVSGVRTSSGRLVTASVPSCDGRGILILDSFVETPRPQQGIADLLDSHPGAEFATPGQCPSLRASLNGARVYPIYVDYGHDMAALCQAKSSRGGNARVLSGSPEFVDPC